MEPLQAGTDAPETSPGDVANDPGLQEAADTLESLLGGQSGTAREHADPEPPPTPERPQGTPGRAAEYQSFQRNQRGYLQRMQETRQRAAQAARNDERYGTFVAQQNKLNQQLVDLLRQQQPAQEEPIPDPLDPRFGSWLQQQLAAGMDQRLAPVVQHFQQQQQQQQAQYEERQLQQAQEGFSRDFVGRYEEYGQHYEAQGGPLAHGWHDRLQTMRGILSAPWTASGFDAAEADRRVMAQIFLIGQEAENRGYNPVAAIDHYLVAQAQAFGLEPDTGDMQDAEEYAFGTRAVPPRNEVQRLAQVQQRSRPAAAAAPRVAERTTSRQSELDALVAAGESNIRKLQQAALRDAHGDMGKAAILLSKVAG
jgi:hypothetical protein